MPHVSTPSLAWLETRPSSRSTACPPTRDHRFYVDGQQPVQPLDGRWRFAWSPCPAARPAGFYAPDADLSAFGSIAVPGHIETQGYGQLQYINILYPWDALQELTPPRIAWEDCPVGSYVTEFDLAPALRGGRGVRLVPGRRDRVLPAGATGSSSATARIPSPRPTLT